MHKNAETDTAAGLGTAPLAHELRLVAGELHRRLRIEAAASDLTGTQFSLLARLDREGPGSAAQLAAAEHITSQAVGQSLTVLERQDLVVRGPHPTDGRAIVAQATTKGRRVVEQSRQARESWIARALDSELSTQELRHLADAIPLLWRIART